MGDGQAEHPAQTELEEITSRISDLSKWREIFSFRGLEINSTTHQPGRSSAAEGSPGAGQAPGSQPQPPLLRPGVGGRPISLDTAMRLQELLFRSTTPLFSREWAAAGFRFHPPHSDLAYALQAGKGGTRAILAAVQAHIITYLLFTRDTECTHLERLCRLGRHQQGQALATALAETLWAAAGGGRAVVCLVTAPITVVPREGCRASSFTDRTRLFEFSEKAAAQGFISHHIDCWAAEPSGGADDGADGLRWPRPPEEGTELPAEPRCETPPAGPQPILAGLPTLLAYRPESAQANVHHEAEEDAEPTCEYCGNLLRPFPFSEDVPLSEDQEDRFCCERSRELYEFIRNERKRLEDVSSLPRAVSTQESLGSEANLLLSKEQENWRQQKRHLARELAEQSLKPSATKGSQQAGSISCELSQELTSPRGGTPEPVPSAAEPKPKLEPQPQELEPEPQPQEELEPEPQPQEEPGPEPESWPEEEPGPEPESWLEEEPEPQPQEEPGPKPESRPEEEPEPELEHEEEPVAFGDLGYDFSLLGKKVGKGKLVQKYYKNGKKFLTMLPDGTSQLFYPSGNLAIIITRQRDQLICIVQEDEQRTAKIRALFQSDGRSTCYYPNGDEWINMSIQGGQYLDQAGNRIRRWTWPNLLPGRHVPLSPIFISLNRHVGVRILAQDKIFISFLAMGRQAKFNMGTKVQVGTASQPLPPAQLGEDELLLLAFRVRILQLFDRMRGCLNFPSSVQWNKMQPPMYLMTQAVKILELCMAADISDELRSSIKAIINAQEL
ncbi:glutamate-rich protein 6 [Cyanistes caeruleus]|uniref:glutamate-rich protein 6 n=1 Tax=Cyanistes caeruleus TaxID=156563 RepID=UPI000CDA54BB|nr:glutamate-rich protein 6 [Cyanistes caeruleus]